MQKKPAAKDHSEQSPPIFPLPGTMEIGTSQPGQNSFGLSWLWCVAILLIVGWTFSPVCYNSFTNLDEPVLILGNPWIQELSRKNLTAMFSSSCYYTYSPVAFLAFALEKRAFGFDPAVFHAVTLVFHLATTLLLGFWIKGLCGNERLAGGTSLLFGLHPLQVETVAWATGQRTAIFGFFFMLALVAFGRFEANRRRWWHVLSLVFLTLSLLTKGIAFSFPVVLLLQRWFVPPADSQAGLRDLIPSAALSVIFVGVSWWSASPQMVEVPFLEKIMVAGHGILRYMRQTVFPISLACIYPYPEGGPATFPWTFQFAPIGVLLLGGTCWLQRHRYRAETFGLGFFLVNILPVSQLVTVGKRITSSDHFMYIPVAGLVFALTHLLCRWAEKAPNNRLRFLPLLVFAIFTACLGVISKKQCLTWRDSKVLYSHALEHFPRADFARHKLGVTFLQEKIWSEAAVHFSILVKAHPENLDALLGLATAHLGGGDWVSARCELAEILRQRPGDTTAQEMYNLVVTCEKD